MSFINIGKSKINIIIFILLLFNAICGAIIFFSIKYKFSLKNLLVATKLQSLCKDCNVVMVSLDTLSANHLPCYGYERNTSPNLCTFAQNNIMFNNAYANSSWTLPSHVSVFTGLFPSNHGVNTVTDALSQNIPLLPNILKSYGYNVLFFIPPHDATLPIEGVYKRIGQGLYSNDDYYWQKSIEMFKQSVRDNKKTFMFLHTYRVHTPYITDGEPNIYPVPNKSIPITQDEYKRVSPEFVDYFVSQIKKGVSSDINWVSQSEVANKYFTELLNVYPDYPKCITIITSIMENDSSLIWSYLADFNYYSTFDKNNLSDVESLRSLYDQTINILDDTKIPLLTNLIVDPEFKDNTILIIFSDHGEEFMEHGHLYHETKYDSNIRVPLIMHIPNLSNIKISNSVQLVDLFPTLMEALSLKTKNMFDGKSLVNKILNLDNKNDFIVNDGFELKSKALLDWPWKLFLAKQENGSFIPYELYDLSKDGDEKNNILFSNTKIRDMIIKKSPQKLN